MSFNVLQDILKSLKAIQLTGWVCICLNDPLIANGVGFFVLHPRLLLPIGTESRDNSGPIGKLAGSSVLLKRNAAQFEGPFKPDICNWTPFKQIPVRARLPPQCLKHSQAPVVLGTPPCRWHGKFKLQKVVSSTKVVSLFAPRRRFARPTLTSNGKLVLHHARHG